MNQSSLSPHEQQSPVQCNSFLQSKKHQNTNKERDKNVYLYPVNHLNNAKDFMLLINLYDSIPLSYSLNEGWISPITPTNVI